MKKHLSVILAGLLTCTLLGTSCSSQPPAAESDIPADASSTGTPENGEKTAASGEITLWTKLAQAEIDNYIKNYNTVSPDVKVKAVVFPGDTYMTKLQASLRSGSGAPDVFSSEIKEFGNLKDTDLVENLSAAPYNAQDLEGDFIAYVAELCKDSSGNIKGLSFQSCPGGFWFNRALAKEYLGTDDADEVQTLLKDWDSIAKVAGDVAQKSDGKIYLFDGSGSVTTPLLATRETSWVVDGKLYDLEFFKGIMTTAKAVRDANGDAKLDFWSAAWAAGFYENQNFIINGFPSWGLHYAIKANTPADATDTANSWGFCQAPTAYQDGGTWFSIYSGSKNKDAAWDWIKTTCANTDYLKLYVEDTGDMVGYIPAIEEVIASDFRDPFTGDQPIYEYQYEAAKAVKPIAMTKYDQAVVDTFNNKLKMVLAGEMTIDQGMEAYVQDLKTQFPELTVE